MYSEVPLCFEICSKYRSHSASSIYIRNYITNAGSSMTEKRHKEGWKWIFLFFFCFLSFSAIITTHTTTKNLHLASIHLLLLVAIIIVIVIIVSKKELVPVPAVSTGSRWPSPTRSINKDKHTTPHHTSISQIDDDDKRQGFSHGHSQSQTHSRQFSSFIIFCFDSFLKEHTQNQNKNQTIYSSCLFGSFKTRQDKTRQGQGSETKNKTRTHTHTPGTSKRSQRYIMATKATTNIVFTTGSGDGDDDGVEPQFDLRSVDNDDDGDLASAFSSGGGSNNNYNGGGASSDGESGVTPGSGDEASTSTGMTGSTNKTGSRSGGIFNRAGISKTLAKREDRAIFCSKALMLLFLAVAASAAAAATFLLFSKSQEESFETEVRTLCVVCTLCVSFSLSLSLSLSVCVCVCFCACVGVFVLLSMLTFLKKRWLQKKLTLYLHLFFFLLLYHHQFLNVLWTTVFCRRDGSWNDCGD